MTTFYSEWQRVLGNLRVQVWKAAAGEADATLLKAASEDFINFGMAYEPLLDMLSTARPLVSTFVSTLGSPNVSDRSAQEWQQLLASLVEKIDDALQELKEQSVSKNVSNNITVSGGTVQALQVGDNNKFVASFSEIIDARIEASAASTEEKAEARSLLRKFVEHPLLNTLLGVGLGSAIK